MTWFRFKKKKDAPDAPAGAQTEAPAPSAEPALQAEPAESSTPAPNGDGEKSKRRRGSRGGRGRKKPAGAVSADGSDGTVQAPARSARTEKTEKTARSEGSQRAERAADRRRQSQSAGQRRRQQQRRAPLPAAKRELVISVDVGEQRVAVIEDERVAEVYLERPERRSIAGNIYLGVVDNVLPGMEAAFVEIGLEKNGFLYVDEIVVPELEGKRHGKKIQDLISRGEQLLVQAVKDPMKTKGARLTTEISLPGRFLVYVPNGEGLGVSRRLEDAERSRLKEVIKGLDVKEGGVIVRTAAEGASAEDIERDFVFLQRLWKTIQARAKTSSAPTLVYQEAELPLRIVRDLFAGDFVGAYVDNDRAHKRIVSYLKKTSPHMIERVHRYKEKEPLFEARGIEKEIASTLDRRVDLPSGGYLVFDYAEAFTVIDVNTGRFVGSRSKSSNQRLEDTITKNNLEAVKEVVRQLRLRDIGGIIVIDFIDMANPKNRASVEDALREELERDRTKTYVVEISPLGLVEMTRQNVTDGPREILTRKCPTCAGDGIVVSDQTVAMEIERKLRALAAPGSRTQAYRVAVHPRVLELLVGPGGSRLAAIEEATRRRLFLVAADGHAHADHFEVLAEGKLADLQPDVPLVAGAEVELKLGEVGRWDATAGVGRVEGFEVVVADAARLVGKKASVTVGVVLEGGAFATLGGADVSGEGPITFESEAEKPTRAPARKKPATVDDVEVADEPPVLEPATVRDQPLDEGSAEEGADEEPAANDGEVDANAGATTKKRTRRGSRGGRRRRKPGTAAVDGAEDTGDVDEANDGGAVADPPEATATASDETPPSDPASGQAPAPRRRRQPRIHVPAAPDGGIPSAEVIQEAVGEADQPHDPVPANGVAHAEREEAGEEPADGDEAAPTVKKKTRRGTRGGRNRRKKPAASVADAAEDGLQAEPDADGTLAVAVELVPELREEGEPAPEQADGDGGYVPMSQWLDDFDRR